MSLDGYVAVHVQSAAFRILTKEYENDETHSETHQPGKYQPCTSPATDVDEGLEEQGRDREATGNEEARDSRRQSTSSFEPLGHHRARSHREHSLPTEAQHHEAQRQKQGGRPGETFEPEQCGQPLRNQFELSENAERGGDGQARDDSRCSRPVSIEIDPAPWQEKTAGESTDEVGVRELEPAESSDPNQMIRENAHAHRLAGNAHQDSKRGDCDDDPSVENGELCRGEWEVGCERGH